MSEERKWTVKKCDKNNWVVFCNDVPVAQYSEKDARLMAAAPEMHELLKETLRFFSKHDIDNQLKIDIDACLLRVGGSPLQCVYCDKENK